MSGPRFSAAQLWDHAERMGLPHDGTRPSEPAPRKRRSYEEHEAQCAVIRWWAVACKGYGLAEQLLFAIPNGSALGVGKEDWQVRQRIIRGKRLKDEGLRAGTWDLFLAVPRMFYNIESERCFVSGCFLEMKTAKGVLSLEQISFQKAVVAQHYITHVCHSSGEVIAAIIEYLKL